MKAEHTTISTADKLSLISNLHTLLGAGIPILESVDSILEDARGPSKKILEAVSKDLKEGKHLYASFSRFPKSFDKVTVNLLKASEEAGTLDTTLKDLKATIMRDREFVDKVKSALTYPLIIMIVFIGVLVMILTVVVPKISVVFLRLRVELPLPTKILITASNFLINNTFIFIGALATAAVAFVALYITNRRLVLSVLFSLPLVNRLIKQIELTRFSRNLALLLSSGLPITSALELASDVVSTKELTHTLKVTREMVQSGKKFSEGLKTSRKSFPPMVVKIIEAGEKTGSLDKSMSEVAENLDYQVSATLKTLTVAIEPIMLVLVGVMVGGMMLAIIAPIYGLIGQVGPQ